jgi:hypothetical protein
MTLCIAWRWQDRISIASDSRISGGSEYADIGVKILVCPVRIITAVEAGTGNYRVLHDSTIGIGLAGHMLTAYLVKEQMADVLANLQYVGDPARLTFSKITEAVFKIYRHAIEILVREFNSRFDPNLFLVGRCPSTGEVSAARFTANATATGFTNHPILQDAKGFTYEAMGTGEVRMNERIKTRLAAGPCAVDFMVLEELRSLIVENEVTSVGGAIQYGKIQDEGFEIFGVADYRWKGAGVEPMPSVRGIDANEILKPVNFDDLYLSERLITPFQELFAREREERNSA